MTQNASCIKHTRIIRNIVEFGCAFKVFASRWQKCTILSQQNH